MAATLVSRPGYLINEKFTGGMSAKVSCTVLRGGKSGDTQPLPDSTKLGEHPEIPSRKAKLLKQQKGKCPWCGLHFLEKERDVMEVDHKVPKALGGRDEYKNLQLLHRHCHDEKTREDNNVRPQRSEVQ